MNMEEFALIMRHEDGAKIASPEQIQQWMKQTMDWIGSIAAQNKFVSGTGLPFDSAKLVTAKNGQPVVTNARRERAADGCFDGRPWCRRRVSSRRRQHCCTRNGGRPGRHDARGRR